MRYRHLLSRLAGASCILALMIGAAQASAHEATAEAVVPACAMTTEATPEAELTPEITPEATPVELTESDMSIVATGFEPFDIRFNPNTDEPFAVVMNFTLFFENQLPSNLEVKRPAFTLAIEGVDWGELASTDFAMGQVQGHATYGIVLQSLTLIRKATEPQLLVLDCIKNSRPVDITVTGTLETYPNDELQTVPIEFSIEDVTFESDQLQANP